MSLKQVLRTMGFDSDDLQRLWGDDRLARLEERRARLERALQERYAALVRRRRLIERLKSRIELLDKHRLVCAVPALNRSGLPREALAASIERMHYRVQRHERAYQIRLAQALRIRQKLTHVQAHL